MSKKKGKSKLGIIAAIVVVAVLVVAGIALTSGGRTPEANNAGPYIPPGYPVVSTSVQSSLQQFRGKVVILDFWATWCGPCRMEIPGFISLQSKYRDKGLEIVGVSVDAITGRGDSSSVAPFMRMNDINYTILLVNSRSATSGFDFSNGIPTTYLIDRQGNIVKSYLGAQPDMVFENDVKRLL